MGLDTSSPPVFSGVRVTRSLVLYACFVDRLSFCPLCCLSFFDLRILITPLESSNSSYNNIINALLTVISTKSTIFFKCSNI